MTYTCRGILIILFATISLQGLAQSSVKDILNSYQNELHLNDSQEIKFKTILEKYNLEFNKNTLTTDDFNVLLKKETLEIYKILNPEQFGIYKKLKESVEPSKKYRFENN